MWSCESIDDNRYGGSRGGYDDRDRYERPSRCKSVHFALAVCVYACEAYCLSSSPLQTTTAVNLVTMTDVEVVTSVVTTEAVTTTEAAVVTTGEAPAITGEVAEAAAVTETSAATTLGLGTERSRVGGPRSFWTVAPEKGTDREKKKSLVILKHPPRLCYSLVS